MLATLKVDAVVGTVVAMDKPNTEQVHYLLPAPRL
jgi:hypothetical protein